MQKGKPISFRLSPDATAALTKAAKKDRRRVGHMVELIVTVWLENNGWLRQADVEGDGRE